MVLELPSDENVHQRLHTGPLLREAVGQHLLLRHPPDGDIVLLHGLLDFSDVDSEPLVRDEGGLV